MREPLYFVYLLGDPTTEEIFYVGVTRDPAKRAIMHRYSSCGLSYNNRPSPRRRQLRAAGLSPVMVIVSRTHRADEAGKIEQQLIARLRAEGYSLENKASGGGVKAVSA